MTQTPGQAAPDGDDREPQPPYPGWSVEQPPPAPGWGGPGWARPASAPGGAPAPSGWSAPSGEPASYGPGGEPSPGPPAGPPPGGWTTAGEPPARGWGWQPPPSVAKPGVVPLRPLGVGELLDGAVTTLRQNPAAMLGLSAVVAAATQLLQVGALWLLYRDLAVLEQATVVTGAEVASVLGTSIGALSITVVLAWLATVLLTGVLTVVVSRAVLGERVTIGQAWRAARPQFLRLVGLTVLVALVVAAPFVVAPVPGLLAAAAGAGEGLTIALVAVGVVAAVPVAVWLYVRICLSTPALMLETSTDPATGTPRRATVVGAMRRSSRLVAGSWWRVFLIALLAFVLAWIISQAVTVPLTLVGFLVGGFSDDGTMSLPGLALTGLAGIISTTITAPFTAGVIVLLYVDRRIRREGLDIALARAAGVTLPAAGTGPLTGPPASPRGPMGASGGSAGWSGGSGATAPWERGSWPAREPRPQPGQESPRPDDGVPPTR